MPLLARIIVNLTFLISRRAVTVMSSLPRMVLLMTANQLLGEITPVWFPHIFCCHSFPINVYIISRSLLNSCIHTIHRFLEMTTFGPKKSEIEALESGPWDDAARANYVRTQMDMPASSHREHYRKRTNSKWQATRQAARSDHPCSPNSKWRTYTFAREDRSEFSLTIINSISSKMQLCLHQLSPSHQTFYRA